MRKVVTALALFALSLAAAACGSSGGSSGGSETQKQEVRVAYQEQIAGGIDPATFYAVEGDSVILSVYQTLLTYKPGTTELAPSLATSWKVSPDGKTYTFQLRKGVKFQDGTEMDSAAVKQSFEREIALKGAPSYMLAQVKAIRTPSPQAVEIELNEPLAAFLDYNASMYGPKIVSPKALKEHAGDDEAAGWLSEHADGTGPFVLASYKPTGPIVLERFDGYWGKKAKPAKVEITIVPSIGDQLLQLRSGQLNLITHGIEPSQLKSLESDPSLQVQTFDEAIIRTTMLINTTKPPFDDLATRRAFVADLDSAASVEQVYGDTATPAEDVLPSSLLDASQDPLPDPGPVVPAPTSKEVTLAYTNIATDLRQLAELMQQSLEESGWKVKLRADSIETQFGYLADPSSAPNAALAVLNPDAAHPAAWLEPLYATEGGLNVFGFSDPKLDEELAAARVEPDETKSEALYGQAAKTAGEDFSVIPLAEKSEVMVAGENLTGLTYTPTYLFTVDYADLSEK